MGSTDWVLALGLVVRGGGGGAGGPPGPPPATQHPRGGKGGRWPGCQKGGREKEERLMPRGLIAAVKKTQHLSARRKRALSPRPSPLYLAVHWRRLVVQ